MSWEALSAVASLVTAIIIGVTAIIAVIQIRHLRSAAQLQSFLDLMSEVSGSEMAHASAYVENVLPTKIQDPTYRRELAEGHYDFETHQELAVGAFWEKVGTLIRFKYIEPTVFIDFVGAGCLRHWMLLEEVAELRRHYNPRIWERFEELATMCRAKLR